MSDNNINNNNNIINNNQQQGDDDDKGENFETWKNYVKVAKKEVVTCELRGKSMTTKGDCSTHMYQVFNFERFGGYGHNADACRDRFRDVVRECEDNNKKLVLNVRGKQYITKSMLEMLEEALEDYADTVEINWLS